jgi:hypothetical protein
MNPETSPFRPGRPVPLEFFVGRSAEIARLRGMVRASAQGTLSVGFVTGERGIGKSSLAAFVRHLVEQDDDAVGCHVYLGGAEDVPEMLRRTFHRLLNESIDKPWHQQLLGFLGNRVERAGLFGVTLDLNLSNNDLATLARDFVPAMRHLLDGLPEPKRAIFLVLDDVNGLARSEAFANWLKSSVDEFATSAPETKLCVLVVGLEDRRRELVARQPSLARVFELIDIAPWSDEEVSEFYEQSFRRGGADISDESIENMVQYTGGMPVLAHELGDAVWRTARGRDITELDVVHGLRVAADVIGSRLLEPNIFHALRSERHRSILPQIVTRPRMRFRRSEVLARLTSRDSREFDNFLRRMRNLGAIKADPEVRGGYGFPNRLHALYFFMESRRHPRNRASLRRA